MTVYLLFRTNLPTRSITTNDVISNMSALHVHTIYSQFKNTATYIGSFPFMYFMSMSQKAGSIGFGNGSSSQLRTNVVHNKHQQESDAQQYETSLRQALALRESIRSNAYAEAPPVYFSTDPLPKRVARMVEALSKELFIVRLRHTVLQRVSRKKLDDADSDIGQMTRLINSVLEEMGMKDVVSMIGISMYEKLSACALYRSPFDKHTLYKARTAKDETIKSIQEIRIAWEEGINEELQAMAVEMKRPFARALESAQHPLLGSSVSVSARENVRFLFDSEDLLETAAAIRDSNLSRIARDRSLGLLKIPLITPTLSELSKRYHEFHVYAMQFGVDDTSSQVGVKFSQARHLAGEEAVKRSLDVLTARKQLRSGIPPSLRGKMWRIALGLSAEVTNEEREEYIALLSHCNREELLTDDLYIMDVLSVSDDTTYFVFDDNMREVALCFSRDSSIPRDADYLIHTPLYMANNSTVSNGGLEEKKKLSQPAVASPPNGIQPFLGFAKYIGPLCYLYLDNIAIYTTMRAMYCRLWCAMNVICSTPGTLYHVCQTFERLLIEGNMKLYSHLARLKIEPLQIAMPWLQLGFVGLLEVEQTLILWDRVIGMFYYTA